MGQTQLLIFKQLWPWLDLHFANDLSAKKFRASWYSRKRTKEKEKFKKKYVFSGLSKKGQFEHN